MNYKQIIKAIVFAILSVLISTPLQVLNGIFITGQKGPPKQSFLICILIISIIMKTLFALSYLLIGKRLPIKNSHLRAFVFVALIWSSAYMPQVLGLAGADGPLAASAFSIPIFLCDTLAYTLDGVLLGLIFKDNNYYTPRTCKKSALIITSVFSAVAFPLLVLATDQLAGLINPLLFVYRQMQVSESKAFYFYIFFYGFLIISGALFPVFYRLTEYNAEKSDSMRFGLIYSAFIWSPVVAIMIAFGTAIWSTFIYIVFFFVIIMAVILISGRMLKKLNL